MNKFKLYTDYKVHYKKKIWNDIIFLQLESLINIKEKIVY